jgi:hypothetical protein
VAPALIKALSDGHSKKQTALANKPGGATAVFSIGRAESQKHNFVRLNLSTLLISYGTMFFSHNKTAPAGLSAAETIQRTR